MHTFVANHCYLGNKRILCVCVCVWFHYLGSTLCGYVNKMHFWYQLNM